MHKTFVYSTLPTNSTQKANYRHFMGASISKTFLEGIWVEGSFLLQICTKNITYNLEALLVSTKITKDFEKDQSNFSVPKPFTVVEQLCYQTSLCKLQTSNLQAKTGMCLISAFPYLSWKFIQVHRQQFFTTSLLSYRQFHY